MLGVVAGLSNAGGKVGSRETEKEGDPAYISQKGGEKYIVLNSKVFVCFYLRSTPRSICGVALRAGQPGQGWRHPTGDNKKG